VRPDGKEDVYHITDYWQRCQVVTQTGWEALPVEIYESVKAAFVNTERKALGRNWFRYDWAQYC